MIKVKGRICTFTGKDFKLLKKEAEALGLSMQDCFTGMLWEMLMLKAREGAFRGKKTV
jgi:hypothetical protein